MSTSNPKRKRGTKKAPVPQPLFDENKFVGVDAVKFFDAYAGRSFNVEKGIDITDMGIDNIVAAYGWQNLLVAPAEGGNREFVREFYANAAARKGLHNTSYVRGREVGYTRERIISYYNLPSHVRANTCAFLQLEKQMMNNPKGNLHLIAGTFGGLPIDPTVHKGVLIASKFLPPHMKYLHRIICERVLPSSRPHEVGWRRAALMHVIVTGQQIDTGSIIAHEINRTYQQMAKNSYNYPLMITGLMGLSGVNFTNIPRDIGLEPIITERKIRDKSHPKGVNVVEPEQEEEQEEEEEEEEEEEDDVVGDWRADPTAGLYYLSHQLEAMELRFDQRFTTLEQRQTANDDRVRAIDDRVRGEIEENQAWRAQQDSRFDQILGRLPPTDYTWPQYPPQYPPPQQFPSGPSGQGDQWPQQQQFPGGSSSQWGYPPQ